MPQRIAHDKKIRIFVAEYIKDFNGTRAAIKAGYIKKNATVTASQLLSKPNTQDLLEKEFNRRKEKLDIKADDVVKNLRNIAEIDLRQAFDEDGNLLNVKDFPDNIAKAISSVETEKLFEGKGEAREHIGYTHKIKFWDKPRCLELLGKHLGMFRENVDVSGVGNIVIIRSSETKASEDG